VNNLTEFTNYFGYSSIAGIFDSSVTSTTSNPNTVGTASNDLKYAVKTFFDNGGNQAVIMRLVNKDAIQATANFVDQSGSLSVVASTNNLTITAATTGITVSAASGTSFANAQPGTLVSFSGITTTNNSGVLLATTANFVIDSVATSGISIVLKSPSGAATTVTTISTGTVVITGGVVSASSAAGTTVGVTTAPPATALTVSAKDHGKWGNNIYVAVTPNPSPNYFDLTVYYSTRAAMTASGAVSSALLDNEIVEAFQGLTLNASDTNKYVLNAVSSKWIALAVSGSTASATRLPAFTTGWSSSAVAATGQFTWDTSYTTALAFDATDTGTDTAVRAGSTSTTAISIAGLAGSEGSSTPTLSTDVLSKLDSVQAPLVLNYPGATTSALVNQILDYVNTRQDSFAIISPGTTSTLANVITNIKSYQSTGLNYAAVYFPNLVIQDPASSITTNLITVGPSGAVAAVYTSTDATRGTFKSPAGVANPIVFATPSSTLTNADFNTVNSAPRNVNIIRTIPGAGTCVMGSRTIFSNYSDKYVAVRRALNYLEYNLKNTTQYAVFEPNDQNLWSSVTGVCTGVLNDYWRAGGLAGETSDQAYYVKCDATNNTSGSVSAGQLNIEIGVALQRPAEYVIIKIGQINGGSTVTSSI
jgi:phage tail sheath protein FI